MSEPIGGRIVTLTTNQDITVALQKPKCLLLDSSNNGADLALAMPAATGSGHCYRFEVSVDAVTQDIVITADDLRGQLQGNDPAGVVANQWEASGTDNTITLNGAESGGNVGDWIELLDAGVDLWHVSGQIVQSGTEVSPFSAV